ncbi:LacI family DNA-binding transcriptional regulator [Microbacterium sp. ZXX196]|uniref:LacI family DNA-binding transcriptional regulator n=1 Tax=Microbacterium sp. ZXX196 TaxID=2609291 RepID=UPI0012B944EB|nr:LacI family DNA-binding transcriptional regulator [Microbacterium sp. ZXX196]MTE24272.1 substrate-binding domain-containing protein [Microbacterium sp. ZXX196]
MTKRVGIRDVAEHAGVSIASVSNALNRPEQVSDALRQRVTASVATLGYAPMPAARQLRAGRSGLIGMTVINISNPFFGSLIAGAEEAASRAGMRVLAGNSDDDAAQERDHLGLFESVQVEGALVAPFSDPHAAAARLRGRGIPVVLVDGIDAGGQLASASFDNVAGGTLVAEHLLALGRRRLLFLGSRDELPQVRDRAEGARRVVRAAGLDLAATRLPRTDPLSGAQFGAQVAGWDPRDRPDAIFCSNDHLAMGVVRALLDGGVRVPEDVAVVGYDDTPLATVAAVPLTSVRQPAVEMGRRAGELLIERIRDPRAAPEAIVFPPALEVRASTVGA